VYVASGREAVELAGDVETQRTSLRADRGRLDDALRAERGRAEAADALLTEWHRAVEGVFLGVMAAAGYHRHKRQWRRKRMNAQERAAVEARMNDVLGRIAAGDPTELPFVEAAFAGAGDALTKTFGGDLAARVVEGYTDRVAGKNLFRRQAVARELARVRADLEGEDPSPTVRLLAEHAAGCWLAYHEATLTAQKFDAMAGGREADYFLKRQGAAQRRFLRAVRSLEQVRKLTAPDKPAAGGRDGKADRKKGPGRKPAVGFGGRLAGVVGAERN